MSDQTINPPDFDDVLKESRNTLLSNINCVQIGKISKVNDNQTCEIEIQVKRRVKGKEIASYPLLVDCPYFVLSGGGAYIDMPVAPDDYCIILFNDRNFSEWWSTGNVKEPEDKRKHALSDGIAIVGINPETSFLERDGSIVTIFGTSGKDGGKDSFAARTDDEVKSTSSEDSAFWAFFSAFFGVITGPPIPEPGNGSPSALQTALNAAISAAGGTPSDLTGKITGGSEEIKIG